MNYQQSFGELFAKISKELIEIDLLTGLLEILKELIELLCEMAGIDFIIFQNEIMQNDKTFKKFINLFPNKLIDKAEECKKADIDTYHNTLADLFGKPVSSTRSAYYSLMNLPFKAYVTTTAPWLPIKGPTLVIATLAFDSLVLNMLLNTG